jgi:hypothetical protein
MKILRDKTYQQLQQNTRDLARVLAHTPNARVEEAIEALKFRTPPVEYGGAEGCVPSSLSETSRQEIERLLDGLLTSLVDIWVWELRRFDSVDRTEQIIRGILDRRYVRHRVSGKTAAEGGCAPTSNTNQS